MAVMPTAEEEVEQERLRVCKKGYVPKDTPFNQTLAGTASVWLKAYAQLKKTRSAFDCGIPSTVCNLNQSPVTFPLMSIFLPTLLQRGAMWLLLSDDAKKNPNLEESAMAASLETPETDTKKKDPLLDVRTSHCGVCKVPVVPSAGKISLCSSHVKDKAAMLQQASRVYVPTADGGKECLKNYLERMEVEDPEKFEEQLQKFCEKSPACGRGVTRRQFDFSSLTRTISHGKQKADLVDRVPLCQADYIKYWTEEAPSYLRFTAASVCWGWWPGLSEAAAQRRWQLDFNRLEREQVNATDTEGNPIGKVWVLYVELPRKKRKLDYQNFEVSQSATVETKAPTDKVIQKHREDLASDYQELLEEVNLTGNAASLPVKTVEKSSRPGNTKGANARRAGVGNSNSTSASSSGQIVVQAAKHKAATVRELTLVKTLVDKTIGNVGETLKKTEFLHNRMQMLQLAKGISLPAWWAVGSSIGFTPFGFEPWGQWSRVS
eukprot:s2538_g20.t1